MRFSGTRKQGLYALKSLRVGSPIACRNVEFYLLPRGYMDLFARIYRDARSLERSKGLHFLQTLLLTEVRTAQFQPDTLGRILYFDAEKDLRLTILTNNFLLPALAFAQPDRVRR
jgi:hypothetical protein